MDSNSWLLLEPEDPRYRLPDDLRTRDARNGQDCGWVEQMRPFIRHFTTLEDVVLDPFAGFGTTLLAAHLEGRASVGIELDSTRAELARERLARHCANSTRIVVGDMRAVHADVGTFALCLTSVPYFGAPTTTVSSPGQLYGLPHYGRYLEQLHDIFAAVRKCLAPGAHVVAMAENLRLDDRSIPLAWDVARVLTDLFVLHEERVLLYRRPSTPLHPGTWASNRSHEYALVFEVARQPLDIDDALELLRQLSAAGYVFTVHGSLARWLEDQTAPLPADIDIQVPFDAAAINGILGFLTDQSFTLRCWQRSLPLPVALGELRGRHYVRAERLTRNGQRMIVDVGFQDPP